MPNRPPRHNVFKSVETKLEHKRIQDNNKIYDATWRKFRNRYLRDNPLCAHCYKEGKIVAANEVDHIIPLTGLDDPTRLDENAVQGLCKYHHSKKTASETHRKRGLVCE